MMNRCLIGIAFVLSGCIGTDYLKSPEVAEKLELSPSEIALNVGQEQLLTIDYFNKYGVSEKASIIWSVSAPTVVSVTSEGKIAALKAGQSKIYAQAGTARDSVQVTVVSSPDQVAKVEINASAVSIRVGDQFNVSGQVKTIDNQILTRTILWKSSNGSVVEINSNGQGTALTNGTANITGEVDGVVSNVVTITVGGIRQGMFSKSGGYEAMGDATLKLEGNQLLLELGSNFKTSFALGTYIYLANTNTSGATIRANGLEIQQITRNGAHAFNVTALNPAIRLTDYQYVIILCKPASVVFGYAQLN